jgi:hypothetical protein
MKKLFFGLFSSYRKLRAQLKKNALPFFTQEDLGFGMIISRIRDKIISDPQITKFYLTLNRSFASPVYSHLYLNIILNYNRPDPGIKYKYQEPTGIVVNKTVPESEFIFNRAHLQVRLRASGTQGDPLLKYFGPKREKILNCCTYP